MSLGWRGREERHLRARPRATGLVRHRLAQGSSGASFRFGDNMTMIAPDAAGRKGHAARKAPRPWRRAASAQVRHIARRFHRFVNEIILLPNFGQSRAKLN